MRRNTGLLMEDGEPAGGQWNFDHDNRQPINRNLDVPDLPHHRHDDTTRQVLTLVEAHFPEHFGTLEGFNWQVTRRQALIDLRLGQVHRSHVGSLRPVSL